MIRYRLGGNIKKEVVQTEVLFTHCTIRREHLSAKKLPTDLKTTR